MNFQKKSKIMQFLKISIYYKFDDATTRKLNHMSNINEVVIVIKPKKKDYKYSLIYEMRSIVY